MSREYLDYLHDLFSAFAPVTTRAMFGGHGIYSGEHFFGILFEGRVYFKVDDTTRAHYEARGMSPFTYEMKGRVMTMRYHEVPPDVLEDRSEAIAWANQAIQVAAKKPVRAAQKKIVRTVAKKISG